MAEDTLTQATSQPVSFGSRFFWGIGSLGTILYLNVVTALVLVYLTTVVKLDASLAGTLVFAARIVDAFSDPAMGWITDRTKTAWGRRRPYLLLGAVVCGASLPLVYSIHTLPPLMDPAVTAFICLVIYSIGFTIFNVPYLAMPVEMTTDRMQRFSVMSYRVIFMMFGALMGSAGAPWLVEKLGQDGPAFQQLGIIAGAIVAVVMFTTFLGTRSVRATEASATHLSIGEQIKTVFSNKPFVLLIGVKLSQFFAIASAGATAAFFIIMVLKQGLSLLAVLGLSTTATIVVSVPFWRWMGHRITKRRGFMIGIVGEILASLTWLIATPDSATWFYVVRGILTGFFSSAILLYSQAMWLDTIDFDQQRTGLNREGMYTSVYVFVERIGYSLGPLVLGNLLSGMGFDKALPLENQPQSAELAVYLGLVWIPVVAYALGFLILCFYRLPEKVGDEIRI